MSFLSIVYCCPSRTIPQGVVYSCSPCSFVTLATAFSSTKEGARPGGLKRTCEGAGRSTFPLHVASVAGGHSVTVPGAVLS